MTILISLSFALVDLASQQSFTLPIEPVHPVGERPGQTTDSQPSEARRAAGSSAARTEQGGAAPGARTLTSEEAQQAFLSRLLLVLGSFVVLCLVLF